MRPVTDESLVLAALRSLERKGLAFEHGIFTAVIADRDAALEAERILGDQLARTRNGWKGVP